MTRQPAPPAITDGAPAAAEPPSRAGNEHAGDGMDRREALHSIARATVATLVAALAPLIGRSLAHAAPPDGDRAPGRSRPILEAAKAAIGQGVDAWAANSRIVGGEANGKGAFLPPGSLTGTPEFGEMVERQLLQAGAPSDVAAAVGQLSWIVWQAWSSSYFISVCDALPTFGAVPGPAAPKTPLRPRPLHEGEAPGRVGISRETLAAALGQLLAKHENDDEIADLVEEFARWYSDAFHRWFERATLTNLVGSGKVPIFAPPYVPAGPVVNGAIVGERVLDAPSFR